jgi:hypothetical protein
VPDGGTLQIGIGQVGDALAQGLIVRHRDNAQFHAIMKRLAPGTEPAESGPFSKGLYGVSEMLIEAFLALIDAGILKREADGVTLHGAFFLGPKSFYRALREDFFARGDGGIYQLRIDGQVVAMDICVTRGEMLVLLKTAYDEDLSVYSPAFLLREDIIRDLYSYGRVRNFEFYGPLAEYQLRWTRDIRTLYHLTCFRHRWVRSEPSLPPGNRR